MLKLKYIHATENKTNNAEHYNLNMHRKMKTKLTIHTLELKYIHTTGNKNNNTKHYNLNIYRKMKNLTIQITLHF